MPVRGSLKIRTSSQTNQHRFRGGPSQNHFVDIGPQVHNLLTKQEQLMMNRYRRDSGRDNRDHIINGGMMALGLQHNQYLDQQMRMSAYPQVEFN